MILESPGRAEQTVPQMKFDETAASVTRLTCPQTPPHETARFEPMIVGNGHPLCFVVITGSRGGREHVNYFIAGVPPLLEELFEKNHSV